MSLKRKHQKTLQLIFNRPVSGSVKWPDIESLFTTLGAEIEERAGSRVGVTLFGVIRVFHRPHPTNDTDKGAVNSIRCWFEENGVRP
ncbi:MAG: type II toxin-antitoxin system HicA family toxin [Aliivibrio sp.]|uniref:type II toxin-antitoxin system HicA family toxin n=1 Tax=Aliivibrio sp. TaxID=1872443 RepID=UPI001A3CA0E4|nr:type II toxin-antitoxin system HicA family toxin [Aliivibrio sp.]